jgi:arylformamidase
MGAGGGLKVGGEFDVRALRRSVAELGSVISPANAAASQAIYAPFHETEPYRDVEVDRDLAYGAHLRQRLDVFRPAHSAQSRPVVLFVHGGSFVGGDKHRPGSPYHDNVALWAVRHGMTGVTMTYRLAPEFGWPAGAEDVAAAIEWVREHLPGPIHLMGTSAGALHTASYLVRPEFWPGGQASVASASLLSGAYDLPSFDPERLLPYLGADRDRHAALSPLAGLVETPVTVLYTVAEFDSPDAQRQALALVSAYCTRHGCWPPFVYLAGHNHFTTTAHLNTPDDSLGRILLPVIHSD